MWWKALILVAAIVWIGGDWLVKKVDRPLWNKLQLPANLLLTVVSVGLLVAFGQQVTAARPIFGMALWLGLALALLLGNLAVWQQYYGQRTA